MSRLLILAQVMLCVMVTFLRRVVVARIMQHLRYYIWLDLQLALFMVPFTYIACYGTILPHIFRSYLVNYMLVLKLMSGAVALFFMLFFVALSHLMMRIFQTFLRK
jgi:hypothetical protein